MMHHYDPKKYPKRPEMLWDKDAGDQTVEQMIAMAKSMARFSQQQQKKKP